jgi:peptidoglycan/LPS O-acetylase OafA/YrhL
VVLGIIYLNIRNLVPSSNLVDVSPLLRDIILHVGYLIPFVDGSQWIERVFWTLSIEFQYYLFLALTIPLMFSPMNILNHFFVLLLLLLSFSFSNNTFHLFPFRSSYFGLGIVFAFYLTNKIYFIFYLIYTVLLSVVVFFSQGILDLLIAFFTLLLIYFFRDFNPKIGDFLGQISYSLYLTHALVGLAFINLMSTRGTSPVGKFAVESIALIITLVFAYYFWKFIEKPSKYSQKSLKLITQENRLNYETLLVKYCS